MPLGLWKSKWEILREELERRDAKERDERAAADARWDEFIERSDARHADLMGRLDKSQREAAAGLKLAIDELRGMRRDTREGTDAINAMGEGILRLIDRFDEFEGRPPGPPDLRSA